MGDLRQKNGKHLTKYKSYIICTSPRSGSTLLCKLLSATEVAGHPNSYFHRPSLDAWAASFDLRLDTFRSERASLNAVFDAAMTNGRGNTGMFGLRLQRDSFEFFAEKLAELHPNLPSDLARLEKAFGSTRFIHLTRRDKIAQAVSNVKAKQTGLWHVAPDGTEIERTAPAQPPVYDADAIRTHVEQAHARDLAWERWFAKEHISPLKIAYEDLSKNPREILRAVLHDLGLSPTPAGGVAPEVGKLADATSRDWIARFKAETGVS